MILKNEFLDNDFGIIQYNCHKKTGYLKLQILIIFYY